MEVDPTHPQMIEEWVNATPELQVNFDTSHKDLFGKDRLSSCPSNEYYFATSISILEQLVLTRWLQRQHSGRSLPVQYSFGRETRNIGCQDPK